MDNDRYAWHDEYEKECLMRAMCNMCNAERKDCNECNECLDHWLRAEHEEKPNEIGNRK